MAPVTWVRMLIDFLELLEKAGQSWWQMLPIGPPGNAPSYSPYDSVSGFAGSPWLVSLELLASEGLLTQDDIKPVSRTFRIPGELSV